MAKENGMLEHEQHFDYDHSTDDTASICCDASHLSMASSVRSYKVENDRQYHAYRDGSYWGPADEAHVSLDSIIHHLFLLGLDDQLFLAPLQHPQRAIDVGTGNGIWAQNFADKFPDAQVIGTDLSPVQDRHVQPNLHFEIDDCCSPWVYPPNHFDYIHVRLLYGSVRDWDAFYRECYDHLKPGGYIEHVEANPELHADDGSIPDYSPFKLAHGYMADCSRLSGKQLVVQPHIRDWIAKAGFVDVVEVKRKFPVGDWPSDPRLRDLGRWNADLWTRGIEGWSIRLLTRDCGWSAANVRKWNRDMQDWIAERRSQAYQAVQVPIFPYPFWPEI